MRILSRLVVACAFLLLVGVVQASVTLSYSYSGYRDVPTISTYDSTITQSLVDPAPIDWTAIYNTGYSSGQSAGLSVGYAAGAERGQREGTSQGQTAGFEAGFNENYGPAYDSIFPAAYEYGAGVGYEVGFADGAPNGYIAGYDAALVDLQEWLNSSSSSASLSLSGVSFFTTINSGNFSGSFLDFGSTMLTSIINAGTVNVNTTLTPEAYQQQAYDVGYRDGFSTGDSQGFTATHDLAYAAAFGPAQEAGLVQGTIDGLAEGEAEGLAAGYSDGLTWGANDGFAYGYDLGYQHGWGDLNLGVYNLAAAMEFAGTIPEPSSLVLAGLLLAVCGCVPRVRRG